MGGGGFIMLSNRPDTPNDQHHDFLLFSQKVSQKQVLSDALGKIVSQGDDGPHDFSQFRYTLYMSGSNGAFQ